MIRSSLRLLAALALTLGFIAVDTSAEATTLVNRQTQLQPGQSITSGNGVHTLVHQRDGNVVLYAYGTKAIWATNTHGRSTSTLVFQGDGNLVLYGEGRALWHTSTHGKGDRLYVQDDGNMVVYDGANKAVWASKGIPRPVAATSSGSVEDAITRHFGGPGTRLGSQARRVASCESQMNPRAVSPTNDHGLFQINARYHQTAFRNVTGQPFYNGVYGPDANARYARDLYNRQGWGPWTCRP